MTGRADDMRRKAEEAAKAHAAASSDEDMWRNVGDEAREAQHDADELLREQEAVRKAEEFEKLEKILLTLGERLQKFSGYRSDNCSRAEYAKAQKQKKKTEEDIRKVQDEMRQLVLGRTEVGMPVGLAEVLDIIICELDRFFVMPERDRQIVALWIVHTHVFLHEVFQHTPHLIVWSEEPGMGKSTLHEFMARLSANAFATARLTGSRLEKYLVAEAEKKNDPFWIEYYQTHKLLGLGLHTLLFDEADRYSYSDLIIGLMNTAHAKHGYTLAADGSILRLFAPIALFRLGDPRNDPDQNTTVSRSIVIEMKLKDPSNPAHKRARFLDMNRYVKRLPVIRQQISELVQRRVKDFALWKPAEPEEDFLLGNRNADNWTALVAIADLAGGHWPKTARALATDYTPPEPNQRGAEPKPAGLLVHRTDNHQTAKIKTRIMNYLRATGRCRRTEIGEKALSNNFKAAVVDAVLNDLAAEGKIKMVSMPPGPKGGPWTKLVELAEQEPV